MRTLPRTSLPTRDEKLLKTAEKASITSTATYSDYRVGAAMLVESPDGQEHIVVGNNYETLTMKSVCAEKHALIRAYSEHSTVGPDGEVIRPKVRAVGIFCSNAETPAQPCGDCRQTLFEVNPEMRVLSAAGATNHDSYDPRATVSTIRELLPWGFELPEVSGSLPEAPELQEPKTPADYVVHFPLPGELTVDAERRVSLLHDIRYMLLVGSPERARKVLEVAYERFGATAKGRDACYCDLSLPGRDESHREFALYVVQIPGGPSIGVASHGVGAAGVEIVLSEIPALMHVVNGEAPKIEGVIRAGTRGALCRCPLGAIALSTATLNPSHDRIDASPRWLEALRDAARGRGMTVVSEDELECSSDEGWPDVPQDLLVEGLGLSSDFFWRGQGRPLYRSDGRAADVGPAHQARIHLLASWVNAGVRWIEMEDFTVHEVAAACGYPSASLGAVIARRQTADGHFQIDYSKAMYAASEMIPTEIALAAFIGQAQ